MPPIQLPAMGARAARQAVTCTYCEGRGHDARHCGRRHLELRARRAAELRDRAARLGLAGNRATRSAGR